MKPIAAFVAAACMLLVLAAGIVMFMSPKPATAGPSLPIHSYDPIKPGERRLAAVPGQVIVKFKQGVTESARNSVIKAQGGTLAPLRVPGYYLVTVKETDKDTVSKTVATLTANASVQLAQPNYYRYADMTPNDAFYMFQWNMPKVQMPSAWDVNAGDGIIVAIVDTGVAFENYGQYKVAPDLASTMFVPGWNFINNNAHANDDNSHGTHVAGTIAQSTNNLTGTAGIAYLARIMPLKALNADGVGQDDWVASAIVWAADNGAQVINLSLGADSPSGILEDAINYAHDKGAVIVAAAGNGGVGSINYPAAYPNAIAVGAVRYDETRVSYSNYGTGLSVVAPGGDLTVDQNNDGYPDGILQQTFDPSSKDPADFAYWFFQGTSMATPHVSGVAAMILAKGVATTTQQVRLALQQSAKDLGQPGWDPMYGYGLIQARSALDWTPAPTPTASATPSPTSTPTPTPPTALTIMSATFSPASVTSGGLLRVDIVVRNNSAGTAQTQGPTPGFVFNEGDTVDSRGYADVAGCWRVGVEFAARSGGKDHPYRWGLGGDLAPGATVTVTGYIRLTTVRTTSYWVGLVQERVSWWQDHVGTTNVTVTGASTVYGLRFAGATATRYAYVYQCTPDGLSQRVWRVDYGRTTATYQTTRPVPSGYVCGTLNPVFGAYQLTVSGGNMTPYGWVTQCTGSGGVRNVWRAQPDGRNVPFQYPEVVGTCP